MCKDKPVGSEDCLQNSWLGSRLAPTLRSGLLFFCEFVSRAVQVREVFSGGLLTGQHQPDIHFTRQENKMNIMITNVSLLVLAIDVAKAGSF
jgi:hypothetical protein